MKLEFLNDDGTIEYAEVLNLRINPVKKVIEFTYSSHPTKRAEIKELEPGLMYAKLDGKQIYPFE